MYAGGWITHAHSQTLIRRPVIYRQPVFVPTPPTNVPVVINIPPTVVVPEEKVSVELTRSRSLISSIPMGALLLVMTVLVFNFWSLPKNTTVQTKTAPVVVPAFARTGATNTVDPTELRCMSENIYFEAGGESLAGKMAVGQVVLNRMKSPNYPKTVCGVVHQKNGNTCMFSWLCEGPKQVKESHNWQQSQAVAHTLLSRATDDLTEGSTHFHGMSVNPKWNLKPTVRIDGHQFYR